MVYPCIGLEGHLVPTLWGYTLCAGSQIWQTASYFSINIIFQGLLQKYSPKLLFE